MKIGTMFARNINRNINGVIKVGQDDEKSLEQELSEYVITRELRGHFRSSSIITRNRWTSLPTESASGFPVSSEVVNLTFSRCSPIYSAGGR